MPISWWLTPKFFDVNVILVAIMVNFTLYAIVSNFLEDFYIPPRVQAANYFGAVLMTVIYFILVLVMKPIPTLYPNKYDWLLIGNGPVLAAILSGVAAGAVLGYLFGGRLRPRVAAAVLAVGCEGLIGLLMVQWILNQQ